MLCKLSLKNIQKSFKDYAIYFFTLILGVAIFYVFNSIDSQAVMLDVTSSTQEIISLMTNMLSGVSVFVSFILGFLIIYASRFLIKRRKKEFGIYLTLGMSKRKISLILFFETLFIGIISLVVGLGIGILLSQFMSILVANMFDANMTKFTFVFSSSACMKTIFYFAIMYLIVMIFNTVNINKCKLIDLLHANKKSEQVRLKNPVLCTIVFFISCLVLSYAYYLVTGGFERLDTADKIFVPIILGTISTFFLFWSFSGLVLRLFMNHKKMYYKGLNSFTVRQISSKINTTVFSMTIICLMLFVTICVLSASLTLKNSLQSNANQLAPADIQLTKKMNLDVSDLDSYTEAQVYHSSMNISDTLKAFQIDLDDYLKEAVEVSIYHTEDLTFKDTLGSQLEALQNQFPFVQYDTLEDIMSISDYNKLARLYGTEEYSLNDDEYMIVADFQSMVMMRNEALKDHDTISVFGVTLSPKYNECKDGFVEMGAQHINTGVILVSDSVLDSTYLSNDMIVGNYRAESKSAKIEMEEELLNRISNIETEEYILPYNNTKIDILEASVGLGALVTFIGLYLGIIFLISSAALLALKELSESSDNKERFQMLRKIGTDEKMIHQALFHQIGVFFLLPLGLALIHSVFGIWFSVKILEIFGNDQLLPSIMMTAVFIVIIYGGYFVITYLCSKNIIRER